MNKELRDAILGSLVILCGLSGILIGTDGSTICGVWALAVFGGLGFAKIVSED